jgi:sterol desaturase/sphingolipid hydroxylase (fatty acid hydroxylase superfamily)
MIIFLTFIILIGWNLRQPQGQIAWQHKTIAAWTIDLAGLLMQGVIIPLLQITVIFQLYLYVLPLDRANWQLHPFAALSLSFIGVDYLYYWNHRLLHTKWLWRVHLVHHTVTDMDILGTSRNTLWTSFAIVYLWIHGLFIYLLADPTWYILGASLTSALDLWRHSRCHPTPMLDRFLHSWLILPRDHAWHHAEVNSQQHCNFGANFKFWDKIHGTYYNRATPPVGVASPEENRLGTPTDLSLSQQLFDPYRVLIK